MTTKINVDEFFGHYPKSVLDRFKKFHAANPHVYQTFSELADEMRKKGRKKYSARTIIEVMRWHYDLQTDGEVFKLSNDYVSIYARLLIFNRPEFEGLFDLRRAEHNGIKSAEQRLREAERAALNRNQ